MKQKFQFGLKGKLLLLVSFGVIILSGLAFYATTRIIKQAGSVAIMGEHRIPYTEALGAIREGINAVPKYLWQALAQPPGSPDRKKSLESVESSFYLIFSGMMELDKHSLLQKSKDDLAEIKVHVASYNSVYQTAILSLNEGSAQADAAAKQMLLAELPKLSDDIQNKINEVTSIAVNENKTLISEAEKAAAESTRLLIIVAVAFGLISAGGGYFFSSYFSKTLSKISSNISELTKQVASASVQVSEVSQQLSSNASEQASSVEETSASLEEITGMVENNVRNAETGLRIVEEVKTSSGRGNEAMESLLNAMNEVMESNKRIEKLVKVIDEIGEKTEIIDEIVFQTKLLSFNASVEAERAGEHGRGFAVVAQEIGNLAQMSGKAALDISGIVKSSIKEAQEISSENKTRVENGVSQVKEAAQILKEIKKGADSVLEGSRQILSASKEQFVGFKQIATAMETINQATQETAASSGESASAGEQLSAHAKHLESLVQEMDLFVSGNSQAVAPNKLKLNDKKTNSDSSESNANAKDYLRNNVTKFKKQESKKPFFKTNRQIKLVANGTTEHTTNSEVDTDLNKGSGSGDWDRL